MSYFDRFYTTTATVIELGDYDDYENTYTINELCTLNGDLQPYSGGLASQDYGLTVECQNKFFCNINDNLIEGRYLKINDIHYKIMYVSQGNLGCELLLKKEVLKNA